ncbi:MAG: hypothetical protein ACK5M3_06395 [Dysgonomonas sp.]
MGIPTKKVHSNEHYSEAFKMYTSTTNGNYRIQYHRFEDDSPLHFLIRTIPHIAIQVENLASEIEGEELLLGPYEPIPGYKVAIINDDGVPVELVETFLSPDELWDRADRQSDLNTEGLEL